MTFDHVIYAARDRDAGAAHVAGTLGLEVTGGGVHDGQGTHNLILPFSGGYLEVLALVDPDGPPVSPLAGALAARLERHGDGLYAWAVCVDDVEARAARLGTELMTIARDGFSARITGVGEALSEPALPFFITRDHDVPDPGEGAGGALESLELEGDEARLRDWLGELPAYVRVRPGDRGVRAVTLGGRRLA
jgi:hypothetical protein